MISNMSNKMMAKTGGGLMRRKLLAMGLAAGLYMFRLQAVRAEDSQIDYRYQVYREDNARVAVDTQSALFDMSITPKLRFTGELVVDTISGATPTGAPAFKDFDVPTPGEAGLNAVTASYNNQMNLAGFPNDPQGFINYLKANFPAFANQVLSTYNQATNSYSQALAANPNYRSSKVPVEPTSDERESVTLGLPISFGHNTLTPQLSYSAESDYVSLGVALNYSRDFNDKNTTLNVGWSHDADSVRDYWDFNAAGNFIWQGKNTDEIFVGINQLINPKAYVTLNFTYGHSQGYLNDQYRQVYAANAPVTTDLAIGGQPAFPAGFAILDGWRPEQRPHEKDKYVGYVSYVQFVTPLKGSAEGAYRFYHDSYGVNAHTLSAAWHQKLGKKVMLSPSFRYYRQSAANFYYYMVPDYNNWPQYYSSDYRLSEFQSYSFDVSLTWRVSKLFSVDATYSRYVMQGLDGATPSDMYPAANVYGLGARLWF
jgi:Protein of unknown function (DUF3570)